MNTPVITTFVITFALSLAFQVKSLAMEAKLNDPDAIIKQLQLGGYVIYLRHHATNRSEEDTDKKNLTNCKTQRNLSTEGREGSKALGRAFTKLGIKISSVVSSPYCRCVDTAKLAFNKATIDDDLHFSIGVDKKERKRRADALNKMLRHPPPTGYNSVIVSHTANLKESVGIWPKPEGVLHVFKPEQNAGLTYIGKIQPKKWRGY